MCVRQNVAVADILRALLESRSAFLADVDTAPEAAGRLLVRSDLTGTMQLYEHTSWGGLRPLTALPDPVGAALYVPGRRHAVIQVDATGDEHHQLYLVDLDRRADGPVVAPSDLRALTAAPAFGHHLAGAAPSGDEIAYVSNRRNGVDFDLWVCTLASGEHRAVYTGGGWCQPSSGYSPDGRYVAVIKPGNRPLDEDLLIVDVRTGDHRIVLPHPDEAAQVGSAAWVGPTELCFTSNVGSDRSVVARHDLLTGETTTLGTSGDWDVTVVASPDGRVLLVIENQEGANRLRLLDARTCQDLGDVPLPEAGVVDAAHIAPPKLDRDGSRIYFSLSTPRQAGDVWVFERGEPGARRLTSSPAPIDPSSLAALDITHTAAFDGERIPFFVLAPARMHPAPPVVVIVHGGPESQATQVFNPLAQAFVARGYGVVIPNVRGSTGYGKRYASLDDRTLRLDSVRDLAAIHAWLGDAGFDQERAALCGASYGGYMVLAGLAFQPELWAAGVDVVGISDLVTFLEHTSDYRRAHREREYGSLVDDRAFLERASPLRNADAMHAPLFVIHGRNDPRVPLSEAEQLVARLRERGVPCELAVYDDEGHGLARLANRIDAYTRAASFLDAVLSPPRP